MQLIYILSPAPPVIILRGILLLRRRLLLMPMRWRPVGITGWTVLLLRTWRLVRSHNITWTLAGLRLLLLRMGFAPPRWRIVVVNEICAPPAG